MNSQKQQILDEVAPIVGGLFGVEVDEIEMETSRESIEAWDSLQHVNLVMDVESHFQIHLSESEIAGIQGIQQLVDTIAEHQAASQS